MGRASHLAEDDLRSDGPSTGTVSHRRIAAAWQSETYKNFGVVLDIEQVYPYLSGREFVRMNARLQKLPDLDAATERAHGDMSR